MADDGQAGRRPNNNNNNQARKKSATVSSPAANPRPASAGSNPANKAVRSASTTKKAPTPTNSTGPNSRLAVGDSISRPSSTDSGMKNVSDNGGGSNGGNRGKPRQNSRGGNRKASSQSQSGGANRSAASTPVGAGGAENTASGDALSSLKRVIGDLKQIPPGATAPGTSSANVTIPNPGAGTNRVASGNGPNEVGPRHRKSASAGNPGTGAFGPNFGPGGFSNQLGPMQEDAEDGYSYVESEDYNDQPGFSQPNTQLNPTQGNFNPGRGAQHQPMGSFSAPRFQSYPGVGQQQQADIGGQGDYVGPTGRPQLAPNFTFGGNRRRVTSGAPAGVDGVEDVAFQFPPQQFDNTANNRRNEPSGPTGLLAEQIAIQNQIEALQAQQAQLLQQQIASNQVMGNAFANPANLPALPGSHVPLPPLQHQPAGIRPNVPANVAIAAGHRRIQSQNPNPVMGQFGVGGGGGGFGFNGVNANPYGVPGVGNMGGFDPSGLGLAGLGGIGLQGLNNIGQLQQQQFQPQQPQRGGAGHGRRHSVNVVANNLGKSTSQDFTGTSPTYGANNLDGFDDGFAPPVQGGHSRQASQANTWRSASGTGQGAAFDLAQATAQLNSLQQFRAAAGGHHQKMPSFSFPNMLPNMMAANMMGGLGGYNILQQQQQQFQLQLQQQSQVAQRKSLFAPYLPQASLPPLLAAGKLVVGILRVNKRNRSDAYISTEVLDADIYICGSKDRNRALEGDIVAVELLDVDDVWGTKKEKEEKKRKKEENAAYDAPNTRDRAAKDRKNDKKKDDVEVEGQGLMLFEDEEVTDEVKPQYAGHVVAVVERMPGQLFSGTLGLLRPSSAATKEKQEAERREREGDKGEEERTKVIERPKIVWFKPTDKRVPLIAIPTEQAPPDFVQNSEAYADKLFVACIKRHPISSLHPFGTLVEELGPIGDVEVETSALLKDCNFPSEDFTDSVTKCVPPAPYIITERDLETRRDLREQRIFTIDPRGARDLDDALSIKDIGDGKFEVGVHIADVSHFVKVNTPLDRDARKRATSVYLVQRSVPMFPPSLSEDLCSLLPNQERLCFSVIFTFDERAHVLSKWVGKTIIKSAAQLTYQHAQAAIEGKSIGAVEIGGGHEATGIEQDIRALYKVAKQLLNQRIGVGMLRINSPRISFTLDDEGHPVDCAPEEHNEAHSLVEEFMLQANISVGQQIAVHLPEQAMLRRHEDPIERRLANLQERAKRMGVQVDITSAGALQNSLDTITDPNVRLVLEVMLKKANQSAKYFCAGMLDITKYNHYALNMPLYTHFTSPIRRYSDIIVHRQLESMLLSGNGDPKFGMDRDTVAKIAQQCNVKRDSAKLAQEQSAHLFLCLFIADLTQRYGPVIRQARVVNVLDAAFDVLIPEFGIEKRVHIDQMPIENHVYDEHTHVLQIYWSDKDVITWLAENSDDEHLKKVKQTAEQHAVKMEVASRSANDEAALFDEDDDNEDEVVLHRATEKSESSKQRQISASKVPPKFEGLRTLPAGHHVQDVKELMTVPVIITADLTKSPPVIKVYGVNPYAGVKKA